MPKENGSPSSSEYQKPIFRTKSVSPEDVPDAEKVQLFLEAQERLQKLALGFEAKTEISVGIEIDHAFKLICAGDFHFPHISSDSREIIEVRELILKDPFTCVVFVGDEIEGWTTKYASTSTSGTHADAQQQIEMIKELLLRPLAQEGRVLAMVGEYFGHPGWIKDASTIDAWRLMTKEFNIPVIMNGGLLHFEFPNGHQQSIRLFHYPEGSSQYDPVHGLRKDVTVDSIEIRPDGAVQGHYHKAAVAKEHYAGPGGEIPVFYISCGSTKGSSPDKPRDQFGARLGRRSRTDGVGQGVIFITRHRGDRFNRNYPFISFSHGEFAGNAIDLLNDLESQHMTQEFLEQVREKDHPVTEFIEKESRMVRSNSPYNEQLPAPTEKKKEDESSLDYPTKPVPVHDTLLYNINTQLPIALHLVENARIGSTVEGFTPLKNYLAEQVRKNPHSLVVFLRNMIDAKSLKKPEGGGEVERFIKLIRPIQDQVIALMLDSNLRQSRLPYLPGTYISQETHTPLIHHLSTIKLAVGPNGQISQKPTYTGAFADKLERHGSYDKPTFGLLRLYNKMPRKPGFIAGGNMPNAGTMMISHDGNSETHYPAMIAPGWWAEYMDSIGSGNVKEGSVPGQAIILMPGVSKDDYMVFPTANYDETEYMHKALLLLIGIERVLGMSIQDVLSGKK